MEIYTGKENKVLRAISEEVTQKELKTYLKLADKMVKYVKHFKKNNRA